MCRHSSSTSMAALFTKETRTLAFQHTAAAKRKIMGRVLSSRTVLVISRWMGWPSGVVPTLLKRSARLALKLGPRPPRLDAASVAPRSKERRVPAEDEVERHVVSDMLHAMVLLKSWRASWQTWWAPAGY